MGRTGQFGGPQVNDHWLSVRPSTTEVLECLMSIDIPLLKEVIRLLCLFDRFVAH